MHAGLEATGEVDREPADGGSFVTHPLDGFTSPSPLLAIGDDGSGADLAPPGSTFTTLAGALILAGRWEAPEALGAALLVLGVVDFFLLPRYLARRWKTPAD